MRAIGFLIGGITLFAIVTTALVTTFIRETSGIEERWGNKTNAERQATVDSILALASSPDYQTNIGSGTNSRPRGGDHDGDGIPDNEETGNGNPLGPGTDPTNPDTDGDGILDGIEKQRGTNPTDPNDGGIQPAPIPTDQPPASQLLIVDNLYKVVSKTGGTFNHSIGVNLGDTALFRIHVEVINEGGTHKLLLTDTLPASLLYQTGTISIDNQDPQPLTQDQLRRQTITITKVGRTNIDLNFSIKTSAIGAFENQASAIADNGIGGLTDLAYIQVSEPTSDNPDNPASPSCTICNLFKLGRNGTTSPWGTYITASTGDTIDFYISTETNNSSGSLKTVRLTDTLPSGLSYINGSSKMTINRSGSATPLADEWIQRGLTLQVSQTTQRFEIYFSAKVETSGNFTLTNTAKTEDWSTPAITKTATAQIKSRP